MSPLKQNGMMKMKSVSKSQRKSSVAPQAIIEKRPFIPDPPMLPSDTEEAELTETELDDQESVLPSSTTASEHEDDDEAYSDEQEDDDWSTKTPKAKQPRSIVPVNPSIEHAQQKGHPQAVPKSSTNQFRVAKLTKYMDNLEIGAANNSTIILSKKAHRKPHESLNVDDDDDEEETDLPVVKKKKRSVLILRVVSTSTLIFHNFIDSWGRIPL
jgi:kinesin family protein 20